MKSIASRELRNHTSAVLHEVAAGAPVAITVHGEVVAELHPPQHVKPSTIARDRLVRFLEGQRPDPDLKTLLDELASETTDDLDRDRAT